MKRYCRINWSKYKITTEGSHRMVPPHCCCEPTDQNKIVMQIISYMFKRERWEGLRDNIDRTYVYQGSQLLVCFHNLWIFLIFITDLYYSRSIYRPKGPPTCILQNNGSSQQNLMHREEIYLASNHKNTWKLNQVTSRSHALHYRVNSP